MLHDLANALLQTIYLVFITSIPVVIIGMCISILHFSSGHKSLLNNQFINRSLNFIVNGAYGLPYIVLIVLFIPLGKALATMFDGQSAALLPIVLAALPVFTYNTTKALSQIPEHLIQMAELNGASKQQIIRTIVLPEAWKGIVRSYSTTLIALTSCATMAGIIGANGLGRLLIEKGYRTFEMDYLIGIVVALAILNYLIKITTAKITA